MSYIRKVVLLNLDQFFDKKNTFKLQVSSLAKQLVHQVNFHC